MRQKLLTWACAVEGPPSTYNGRALAVEMREAAAEEEWTEQVTNNTVRIEIVRRALEQILRERDDLQVAATGLERFIERLQSKDAAGSDSQGEGRRRHTALEPLPDPAATGASPAADRKEGQ